MKLIPLGSNKTLLRIASYEVLFSYQTPVAGYKRGVGWFRTEKKYSRTTSKHINSYLGNCEANTVTQSWIDNLVAVETSYIEDLVK